MPFDNPQVKFVFSPLSYYCSNGNITCMLRKFKKQFLKIDKIWLIKCIFQLNSLSFLVLLTFFISVLKKINLSLRTAVRYV